MNNKFKERGTSNSNSELQGKYFVNEQIRADKLLVIREGGENVGVVSRAQALQLAEQSGLDLVQVGEKDEMIVAKIMDFGKFLYEKKKQLSDSKKHQKIIQVKEIKIRPNIGEQDFSTKLTQAAHFFAEGKKVKFTLQFKGREVTMMDDLGAKIFNRIGQFLAERQIGPLIEEKDAKGGIYWSKIYFLKEK